MNELYEEVEAWELDPSFELLSDDDYIKSK